MGRYRGHLRQMLMASILTLVFGIMVYGQIFVAHYPPYHVAHFLFGFLLFISAASLVCMILDPEAFND